MRHFFRPPPGGMTGKKIGLNSMKLLGDVTTDLPKKMIFLNSS